jgi:hypothetical protein
MPVDPPRDLRGAELRDLAGRWRRARRAALHTALGPERAASAIADAADLDPEAALVAAALATAPEAALRGVFDHSLRLGEGFRRFFRVDVPLPDLVKILPQLEVPCLATAWTRVDAPAYLATRAGCGAASWHGRACDYWREAIAGLVLGITGGVRMARHESRGHGGARCVDALYVHAQSPLRFGPIPDDVRPGLDAVRRTARAFDSTYDLEFLGISENVLHYQTSRPDGPGAVTLSSLVERAVRRRFPWLTVCDASPRPVLGASP